MKILKLSEVPKQPYENPIFVGGQVWRQVVIDRGGGSQFDVNIVSFAKGARNKFHTHTSDQIMVVTEGTGIVATEGEERVVTVGDIIHVPAGEKHWHGATKDSSFAHLYVMNSNNRTEILEK